MESGQLSFDIPEPDDLLDYIDDWGGDDGYEPTEQPKPTSAEPGTPGKIDALAERLAKGQHLWHEQDAKKVKKALSWEDAAMEVELEESLF